MLPWDEEIFGFPVAEFRSGSSPLEEGDLGALQDALSRLHETTGAELVCVRLPADDTARIARLSDAGFRFVDFSLEAKLARLERARLPELRISMHRALLPEHPQIERIAGRGFQSGRYHTDRRFPRQLADRRFVVWVRNALADPEPTNHVVVLGHEGVVAGFFHLVVKGGVADLRLGAVDPETEWGIAGFALYAGTLRVARELGAERVTAKMSALNTRVANVFAALGFQFSRPEVILHWHAPGARHLVRSDKCYDERENPIDAHEP
jgi:RimJ/RimL family protein N-acetyltransferase